MSFLRQLWKHKCEAWGPQKEVQSSLFKNAERIGIDPKSIALAMPMWNPGNQIDYSRNRHIGTNTSASFCNNALQFNGTSSNISIPNHPSLQLSNNFIVLQNINIFSQNRISQTFNKFSYTFSDKHEVTAYNGVPAIYNNNNTWMDGGGSLTLTLKKDICLLCNFKLSKIETYIDIKTQAIKTTTVDIKQTANPFVIGCGLSTENSTTKDSFFTGLIYQTNIFSAELKSSQISLLSDNPYQLWNRVAPVSYFIPGGTPGGLLEFSGNISAISNILGQIRKAAYLDGAISAVSSASGSINKSASISGSVSATASATGNIAVAKTLTGSITGQSVVTGSLSVSRALLGNISAIADVQGQITLAGYLQMSGNIGAVAEAVGSMALAKTLSGNVSAIADVSGQVAALKRLSGFIDAVADVQGSVTIESDNRIQFSGNIGAMAAIQGSLGINKGLTGAIQATSTVDGNIYVAVNLTGSVDAIADVIGNMRVIGAGSLGVIIDPFLTNLTKKLILKSLTNRLYTKQI